MFLDSAQLNEIEIASGLGYVDGVTTNPLLFAQAHVDSPIDQLELILERFPQGSVLYQPQATDVKEAEEEANEACDLDPDRVAIKLIASDPYFGLAAKLVEEGIECAMTAVYSPAQALLAHDAGCTWVIPYVSRAERLASDTALVSRIREILQAKSSDVVLLAASIKTPKQALQAIVDGANDVSAPLDVLQALALHPLTKSAAEEFEQIRFGVNFP